MSTLYTPSKSDDLKNTELSTGGKVAIVLGAILIVTAIVGGVFYAKKR